MIPTGRFHLKHHDPATYLWYLVQPIAPFLKYCVQSTIDAGRIWPSDNSLGLRKPIPYIPAKMLDVNENPYHTVAIMEMAFR